MRIAIANDHGAIEMKQHIHDYLIQKGYICNDFGVNTPDSVDYPIYGEKVGKLVASGEYDLGICICGTGVGISLAANRVKGIRAVVCSEPYSAKMSREHNNANVLCFGARVVGEELAKMIVDTWLEAEFQGGRHLKRVEMLDEIC